MSFLRSQRLFVESAITIGQFSLQIYFARIFHAGGWAF